MARPVPSGAWLVAGEQPGEERGKGRSFCLKPLYCRCTPAGAWI